MGRIFLIAVLNIPINIARRRADRVHTPVKSRFAWRHPFRDVAFKSWEIQIHTRFRLLLPAAHPRHLSSLLECMILRYVFSNLYIQGLTTPMSISGFFSWSWRTCGKRNYSCEFQFVKQPDIYNVNVRWVVASALLGDRSTQPRFMHAKVLL